MYSFFLKALRITLGALLLFGITVITWNFLSRRDPPPPVPEEQFLSSEVKQQTTEFEYTERRAGRPLFKVEAQISTETLGGLHKLSKMRLTHYDERGEPAESVSGREATYEIQERRVDILGDVKILLVDGTQILSNRVRANLAKETVVIDEGFRIRRGQVTGRGRSLLYQIQDKALLVSDRFQLALPQGSGQILVDSDRVHYDIGRQRMTCSGDASIREGGRVLRAARIEVFLTKGEEIDKLLATGRASLAVSWEHRFEGDRIDVFFQPESGRLRRFQVWGSDLQRATYDEPSHHLEGDRIEVLPSKDGGNLGVAGFERLTAFDEVRFSSTVLSIEESKADFFVLKPIGKEQRRLDLKGSVSLLRRTGSGVEERVRSERLILEFWTKGTLEQVRASGPTTVHVVGEKEVRRLEASGSVEVLYVDGVLDRVVAKKDALLSQSKKDEESLVEASEMQAWFKAGGLKRVVAHGGVDWNRRLLQKTSTSSSDRLKLDYWEGRIVEAVQSGTFYYRDQTESGEFTLRSERATFLEDTETVEVQGREQPVLRHFGSDPERSAAANSTTRADRIRISRTTGAVAATGRVRTVFENGGEDGAALVSGRLDLDPESGWLTYSERPRLLQRRNLISGRLIRFNQAKGVLEVEDEVESLLVDEDPDEERTFRITSDRLAYHRLGRLARYQGGVQLITDDLALQSPLLDLHFESSSLDVLEEAVASGGVHLQEQSRQAKGDRAVYDLRQGRLELTGDLARVRDPEKGNMSGSKLTFYLGTDRLSIESPPPSSVP